MYSARYTYRPALGKGSELANVLKDRVKDLQGKGHRMALLARAVFTEGPQLQVVTLHDKVADFESDRRKIINDPGRAEHSQQADSLLSEPINMRLFEQVVPLASSLKAGQFLWRGIACLADPMQEDGFVTANAEFTRSMQKAAINAGLEREHFAAPHGQTVQFLAGLDTFAAVEDFWKARAKTPGFDKAVQSMDKVEFRRPSDTEMWEVLVGAPGK